jgi:hypothetical protein
MAPAQRRQHTYHTYRAGTVCMPSPRTAHSLRPPSVAVACGGGTVHAARAGRWWPRSAMRTRPPAWPDASPRPSPAMPRSRSSFPARPARLAHPCVRVRAYPSQRVAAGAARGAVHVRVATVGGEWPPHQPGPGPTDACARAAAHVPGHTCRVADAASLMPRQTVPRRVSDCFMHTWHSLRRSRGRLL